MDSQVFLGMGAHAQTLGSDTANLLGWTWASPA